MSWVTVIWSMTTSACLVLALMNLFIWCRQRDAWANLLFALMAVGTAAIAAFELAMMRAETTASFGLALRWIHMPACVVVLSLAWFVRLYLNAGRTWLLRSTCGLHVVSLILNFLLGQSLNYWAITRLRPVSFLGESVPLAEATGARGLQTNHFPASFFSASRFSCFLRHASPMLSSILAGSTFVGTTRSLATGHSCSNSGW
jgi:hypothetical protein